MQYAAAPTVSSACTNGSPDGFWYSVYTQRPPVLVVRVSAEPAIVSSCSDRSAIFPGRSRFVRMSYARTM